MRVSLRKVVGLAVAALLTLGFVAAPALAAPTGYGVNVINGYLYTIDLANGNAVQATTFAGLAVGGLTFAPDGTLYGVDAGAFPNPATLVTLDPATGALTTVGNLGIGPGLGATNIGLAVTPDGTLYMTVQSQMFTVNRTTGAATALGSGTGVSLMFALASDCAGNLYGLNFDSDSSASHLVAINRTTGAGTELGTLNPDPNLAFNGGLAIDHSTGGFWSINAPTGGGGPSNINTINPTTFATNQTAVANVASVTAGLRFDSLAINASCSSPTPAAAVDLDPNFAG
jgi:hypothetical protein